MKYCSMRKRKTLDQEGYMADFWIKENDILRLFECFQLSGRTACCQKRRCDRIVALHTFEEKTFLSLQMQRRAPITWAKLKFVWYLHSILFINVTITNHHHIVTEFIFFTTAIFTEICRCSSWKRCTFI